MEKKMMKKNLSTPANISRSKSSPELLDISRSKKKTASKCEPPAVAVGLPALRVRVVVKPKLITLEDYQKELLCCKLQIAMSIVKLRFLEKQLIKFNSKMVLQKASSASDLKSYSLRSGDSKKKVSSSAAAASTEERYGKEIRECREYIEKKQIEFLRLRPIWRELKEKEKEVVISAPKRK